MGCKHTSWCDGSFLFFALVSRCSNTFNYDDCKRTSYFFMKLPPPLLTPWSRQHLPLIELCIKMLPSLKEVGLGNRRKKGWHLLFLLLLQHYSSGRYCPTRFLNTLYFWRSYVILISSAFSSGNRVGCRCCCFELWSRLSTRYVNNVQASQEKSTSLVVIRIAISFLKYVRTCM